MCTVFPTNKTTHAIHPNETNCPHTIYPNTILHSRAIHPNETVGAVPACPPECPRSGVSMPRTHALCAGILTMDAPLWGDTGGHTGPPLPISTKPCGVPLPIAHSIALNHAVCHYPIGVILSIAKGWQVQRCLPWVTMQARRLPPWGLYFFSSPHYHTRRTNGFPHANGF